MRLISIIIFLFCSKIAIACDCPVLPLTYRTQSSEAVFLGKIVSYKTNSIDLQVIETFKGHLNAQITIPTGDSMCDYFFSGVGQPGSRFLIFMSIKDGKPNVSQCLGSAPESKAAEEIMLLRSSVPK
jgi:hypothetical protein